MCGCDRGKEDTVSRDSLLSSEFESVETPTEFADSRSTTPPTATQPLRVSPAESDYAIHYLELKPYFVVFLFSIDSVNSIF
jgi:hypothetical protein